MKLIRIVDNRFHAALNKLQTQPLPLRVAFKLKGIVSKVNEEFKKYDEVRQSALEKYGNKGEDGKLVVNPDKSIPLSKENMELFAKEMNDLTQNTVLEVGTLSVADLGEKIQLTAEEVGVLDGVLVE